MRPVNACSRSQKHLSDGGIINEPLQILSEGEQLDVSPATPSSAYRDRGANCGEFGSTATGPASAVQEDQGQAKLDEKQRPAGRQLSRHKYRIRTNQAVRGWRNADSGPGGSVAS